MNEPRTEGNVGSARQRGDRSLLYGLVALLAIAASLTPIGSYDYWWHLATGRLILERGSIPHADPFSFTAAGTEWIDHEWLFQILAYGAHEILGPGALVVMKILCVIALTFLLAGHLRHAGHGPAGTAGILVVTLLGSWFRFQVRPEMATLLLVPLILVLATRARDGDSARPLVLIPVLCALGANLHVGIVLAPAFLLLALSATVGARLVGGPAGYGGGRTGPGPAFERRLAVTTAASFVALAANPYGFAIYGVPFHLSRLLASLPWPNLEWARPEPRDFPLFYVSIAATAIVLAAGRRRFDPIAAPALLLTAVLALLHLRNIGLFFLLLPLGIAGPARAIIDRVGARWNVRLPGDGRAIRPGFIAAAVIAVSGIPLLTILPPRIQWGLGISSHNEPHAAVDFLEREGIDARLFNDVRFGGYLIWRRGPQAPVFIDGRNEVYADLLRDIAVALRDGSDWDRLLERHGIGAAFLRYPGTLQKVVYGQDESGMPRTGARAFSAAYFPKERWALVYWDDDAMIFLRREPRHDRLIERLEYRHLHPDDWQHLLAAVVTGRAPLAPILGELDRKLLEDPASRRARWLQRTFSSLAPGGGGGAEPGGQRERR